MDSCRNRLGPRGVTQQAPPPERARYRSMQRILPAADFFSTPNPSAIGLPHLVAPLDAELIGKVAQLTKSHPGIWNVPAPFDTEDRFDNLRDNIPIATWALPLNQ